MFELEMEKFEKLVESAKEAQKQWLTVDDWKDGFGWMEWMEEFTEEEEGEPTTEAENAVIEKIMNEAWSEAEDRMRERKDLLKNFVMDILNEGNAWHNADLYAVDLFNGAYTEEVTFERRHRELYNKLLSFCIENNLTVISTQPATLATVVRVEL
jgi:hypothetical protein